MNTDALKYFAAHAPETIPEWFKTPMRQPPRPPKPDPEISERAKEWERDGIDDLESLFDNYQQKQKAREYQDARNIWFDVIEENLEKDMIDRFFAWRWYYAEMMEKELTGRAIHFVD